MVSLSYSSAILGLPPSPSPPYLLKGNSPEMEISGKTIIKLSSRFHKFGILFPEEMISNYFDGRGFQKLVDIRETQKAC